MNKNPLNEELFRRIEDALEERRTQRRLAVRPVPVSTERRGTAPGRREDDLSEQPGTACGNRLSPRP